MPFTWPARLPKVLRLPLRIESAQAGLVAMSIRFLSLISGGTDSPLRMSQWRWPSTCRSTVSMSALHLAAAARSISVAHEAAVAHDVELEPERLVDRRRHVLDRADRHGRERVRDAGGLRGAAGEDLAISVHHAAEPDRRRARTAAALSRPGWWCECRARDTSTSTRWRSLICSKSARLARRVSCA